MFYVLQNESTAALRRVPILLTDAATGTTAQTGVAITNIYPSVNINGGAFAGGAGTVAEAGYGQYYYEFDAAEVATLGLAGIHVTAVGCRDYDAICQVAAFNMYSGAGAGITAGDVWAYVIPGPSDPAETVLANINTNASNASSQTGSSAIRDAVWDTDVSYLYPSGQTGGALYAAAFGATDAGAQVWNYDISAISGAGLAGTQLNIAASAIGITAGDVWSYATREITGGLANTVTTVTNPVEVSTPAMAGIANTVWSTDISTYTTAGTAGTQLNIAASGGAGITVGDVSNAVWNSPVASYGTNGTFGKNILRADTPSKVGDVTLYSAGGSNGVDADVHRIANDAAASTALKNILTGIGASMTTNITGNITGNLSGSVGSVTADVNVSTASMSGIANTVWSTDVSGYTSPSAGFDLANASSGAGLTAGDVWSYGTRTLTSGSGISAADVWNYSLTSSGQSADATLGNADDQATGANTNTTSPTLEANIWGYATRTLTSGSGITAGDVWSYATRTTTGGVVDTNNDKTDYSLSGTQSFNLTGNITGNVSGSVGSVTNPVDITTSAMSGTAGSVWNYVTRTLTSSSAPTAADIWSYAGGRTITGGIADTVTNVSNGVTVSANNDKTGYSLSGTQSFNLTGNITGSVSGSVGSVTGSVGSVVSPVLVATASMSGIAGTVWSYTPRTLTSGAGATAGDIWTYNIASITSSGTAGATLNDASVSGSVVTIVNGPYRLTSIAEGTDGRVDILADSVQTIQLNCLDGFGQPFNITGYSCLVNVYDISGALTVTYTPTVDFASSGILSFDIDTDVTAVSSTYTLVVELTAGAEVVQLGPLQILVRPL